MREALKPFVVVASFVALVAAVEAVLQGHDRDEPLVITRLVLEESRDVDRHFVEDVYRATLKHTGGPGSTDFAGVTASILHPFGLSAPGLVQIIDGDLAFGTVRSGETVKSVDTVTIRRLRHQPLEAHQLRWSIRARPDLVLSDDWAGRWRVVMTTRDADSARIVSVADITDDIGPGEPVGFSLFPPIARCIWHRDSDTLDATCSLRGRFASCRIEGSATVRLQRRGDTAAGYARWRGENTDCGPATSHGGQTMEIAARRQSSSAGPQPFSIGLLKSFAIDTPLFPSMADAMNHVTEILQ